MKGWPAAILIWTAPATLAPPVAEAIPAFARRYQTSCTTCHVVIPKLNAFGVAFRNNGYRIPPHDEKFVKTPDVPLGAPGWRKLWPDAVWPGAIPGMPPVALRIYSDVEIDPGAPARVDFVFPRELEILAGGTAGPGISFWAELEISDSESDRGFRAALTRAFVQFDQIGGTTLANLLVGRYELRAVPFSRAHRRLTPSHFLTSEYRAVTGGFDFRQSQAGFEFWGARSGRGGTGGIEYAIGVVNGSGPARDHNTNKDVYYRLAYKLGGFGLTGSLEDEEQPDPTDSWRDDSVRIGAFGYRGRGLFDGAEDAFWRLGGDIDVFIGDLNLSAVLMRGRDTLIAIEQTPREFTAGFVEANCVVKPWIVGIVRYETVARARAPDIRRVVPALVLALRANVRVVADWERFLRQSGPSRARVRLDLAF
jgi:hypothetical protein